MTILHRNGSYDVEFSNLSQAFSLLPEDSWFVTDENVFRLYGAGLTRERALVLPPGEVSKGIGTFEECLEWLAVMGAGRRSTIVAFGGGVIGDLGGFVAASYKRGIPYIQVPTTLIAQVDSSIGGKVGIDLKSGKNLAGAFYPPTRVIVCPELLDTLDERQFNNGMAEVWKYGFIADSALLGELHANIRPRGVDLEPIIRRCISLKAEIVESDELEQSGLRAKLNFGHTVGHALEHATGYRQLLHGEAIAIGMVAESRLGEQLGISEPGVSGEVRRCLKSQNLPVDLPPGVKPYDLLNAIRRDKKRDGEGLAFGLLTHIGGCKLVQDVAVEAVQKVLEQT